MLNSGSESKIYQETKMNPQRWGWIQFRGLTSKSSERYDMSSRKLQIHLVAEVWWRQKLEMFLVSEFSYSNQGASFSYMDSLVNLVRYPGWHPNKVQICQDFIHSVRLPVCCLLSCWSWWWRSFGFRFDTNWNCLWSPGTLSALIWGPYSVGENVSAPTIPITRDHARMAS